MTEKPPALSGQIRDIIEREYATPPIISGKCWEERATVGIAELLEPLIQQAKEEVARKIVELAKHEFEHWEGSNTEDFIYSQFLERE